ISRVLVGAVSGFFASIPAPTEIVVVPITIILTLLFGTLFMFIISYRSAKRTAGIAAVETLRFYIASETRRNYRPTLDIFFLALRVTWLDAHAVAAAGSPSPVRAPIAPSASLLPPSACLSLAAAEWSVPLVVELAADPSAPSDHPTAGGSRRVIPPGLHRAAL